jgi:hypothetical protein
MRILRGLFLQRGNVAWTPVTSAAKNGADDAKKAAADKKAAAEEAARNAVHRLQQNWGVMKMNR